ncbi:MAG TPA: hypothetical protein PLW65_10060 [Pseudomonadota bacterium]|nr:hypothetical protein [Pseudomonadota bacterium]
MRSAIIWDTSVLDVYLQVPGKQTCGPDEDKWDKERIDQLVQERSASGTLFVMPVAVILECGNHIAQASGDRFKLAQQLAQLILAVADGEAPWAEIASHEQLWSPKALRELARDWPSHAAQKISLADLSIQRIADYFDRAGYAVAILTGDRGLQALAPSIPAVERPRRRS